MKPGEIALPAGKGRKRFDAAHVLQVHRRMAMLRHELRQFFDGVTVAGVQSQDRLNLLAGAPYLQIEFGGYIVELRKQARIASLFGPEQLLT